MAGYDGIISIPKFGGINQASDEHNTDLKYAYDGRNFDTRFGGLKPYRTARFQDYSPSLHTDYHDFHRKLTLDFMTKRWARIHEVTEEEYIPEVTAADPVEHTFAIAVTDSGIFYKRSSTMSVGKKPQFDLTEWKEILDPDTGESFFFANPQFSSLAYEMNYYPPEPLTADVKTAIRDTGAEYYAFNEEDYDYYKLIVGASDRVYYARKDGTEVDVEDGAAVRLSSPDAPIDCLLLSNDYDFICVYAPIDEVYDYEQEFGYQVTLKACRIHVDPANTGTDIHFKTIARYCERIIGAGIPTDPDKVMYSAPFDFFNWQQNNAIPEDGAGDIQQPNWDGDGFIDLQVHGNSLLCIKKHAVWKIQGTDPSQFVFKKQYGEGAISSGSVQTNGYYTYMLSENSVKVFDGSNCYDLQHGSIQKVLESLYLVNPDSEAFSAMSDGRYYLIVRGSMIIFDTNENTYNVCNAYEEISVSEDNEVTYMIAAIASHDNRLFALVTNETAEGSEYDYDVRLVELFKGEKTLPVSWESSWIDLNARNINKSGFNVYIMAEPPEGEVDEYEYPEKLPIKLSIITEKKTKTKETELVWRKNKRIQINNQGRMFKLRFEIPTTYVSTGIDESYLRTWQIATGIQIYIEYDYD